MLSGFPETSKSLSIVSNQVPENAEAALLGSSESVYTTTSDSVGSPITLTVNIKSVDMPTIVLVSFTVAGVQGVDYHFVRSDTQLSSPAQHETTDPSLASVATQIPVPVSADSIVISLTPAASSALVTVDSMFVDACYTPGICFHCAAENSLYISWFMFDIVRKPWI